MKSLVSSRRAKWYAYHFRTSIVKSPNKPALKKGKYKLFIFVSSRSKWYAYHFLASLVKSLKSNFQKKKENINIVFDFFCLIKEGKVVCISKVIMDISGFSRVGETQLVVSGACMLTVIYFPALQILKLFSDIRRQPRTQNIV